MGRVAAQINFQYGLPGRACPIQACAARVLLVIPFLSFQQLHRSESGSRAEEVACMLGFLVGVGVSDPLYSHTAAQQRRASPAMGSGNDSRM